MHERYREAARAMGNTLVERGIELVFGGGRVGLMGEIADTVLKAGGTVHGVIPQKLLDLEVGHEGCTELFVVEGMHARKMKMMELSDAFIAMPGGYGTMEELFEVTTWTQLEYQSKPVGVLNVDGYYDGLLGWIEHAYAQGFIRDLHRDLIVHHTDPAALLDGLSQAELPGVARWIDKV
ncbi:MAG TPA: TIGR00730 family Rossman fold protein [Deltaproteobacteria bacterium]|nr:TIGR00730 family Rossman fold protein [Deltaproteobacteria bacterium]